MLPSMKIYHKKAKESTTDARDILGFLYEQLERLLNWREMRKHSLSEDILGGKPYREFVRLQMDLYPAAHHDQYSRALMNEKYRPDNLE